MRLICVGDNVVDCYLDQGLYYPGGNAVNVAVNCRRNGVETVEYIGVFGDDPEADHIKWALDQEGVAWSLSRKTYAASGHPAVSLDPDGDRVFVGGPKDTAQHIFRIRLTPADLAHIGTFNLCHTSCYSGIEPELPALAKSTDVSYDFSTRREPEYIDIVAPYVRMAFFSGSELTEEEITSIIDRCHRHGTEIVGVTQGSKGALFSRKGERFLQGIKPVEKMVDTMGAGDSFIAGFITRYMGGSSMEESLDYAATRAAATCGFHGGFGYPKPFEKR